MPTEAATTIISEWTILPMHNKSYSNSNLSNSKNTGGAYNLSVFYYPYEKQLSPTVLLFRVLL